MSQFNKKLTPEQFEFIKEISTCVDGKYYLMETIFFEEAAEGECYTRDIANVPDAVAEYLFKKLQEAGIVEFVDRPDMTDEEYMKFLEDLNKTGGLAQS